MDKRIWLALVLALAGCAHDRYEKTSAAPLVTSPRGDLTIDLFSPPVRTEAENVLIVPVRVENHRQDTIVIDPDRSLVEQWNGWFQQPTPRFAQYRLAPGRRFDLVLVFGQGDPTALRGSSFRVYLWVQDERGRLIEDLEPLVLRGAESFSEPTRPLTARHPSAERDFPPPDRFTPKNAARRRLPPEAVCPSCGGRGEHSEGCERLRDG